MEVTLRNYENEKNSLGINIDIPYESFLTVCRIVKCGMRYLDNLTENDDTFKKIMGEYQKDGEEFCSLQDRVLEKIMAS